MRLENVSKAWLPYNRKESQEAAITVIKFACDSLRSNGNQLKICLRLLVTHIVHVYFIFSYFINQNSWDGCRKQS